MRLTLLALLLAAGAPAPVPPRLVLADPAPNPAQGLVRVGVEGLRLGEAVGVAVLDARGREVALPIRVMGGAVEIQTGGLAPGLYQLRVVAGGETATVPIVVAR